MSMCALYLLSLDSYSVLYDLACTFYFPLCKHYKLCEDLIVAMHNDNHKKELVLLIGDAGQQESRNHIHLQSINYPN